MKRLYFITTLFSFLASISNAQEEKPIGLHIYFIAKNSNHRVLSSFSNFSMDINGVLIFEKGVEEIGLFLYSNDVYTITFLSGKTIKNVIIDTRYIESYIEVMFGLDFSKNKTLQTIYYNYIDDQFYCQ
jgi:hypothetical protein